MTEHFNNLTPVEAELLALLSEECGEIVQSIGKILRHGLGSFHPYSGTSNLESLEREMGDVRAAMILLCEAGITSKSRVANRANQKMAELDRGELLHHAKVLAAHT